jgi:hypothetical protein
MHRRFTIFKKRRKPVQFLFKPVYQFLLCKVQFVIILDNLCFGSERNYLSKDDAGIPGSTRQTFDILEIPGKQLAFSAIYLAFSAIYLAFSAVYLLFSIFSWYFYK